MSDFTNQELRELLTYDPDTGVFTWLESRGKAKKGSVAGTIAQQYRQIQVNKKLCLAHRLAWFYVYGYWPKEIDHINHDKDDNRINNLREVTRSQNSRNQKMPKNNKSGHIGVSWDSSRKRFIAGIKHNNKYINGGSFKLLSDAIVRRKELEVKYNFHPNHGKSLCV